MRGLRAPAGALRLLPAAALALALLLPPPARCATVSAAVREEVRTMDLLAEGAKEAAGAAGAGGGDAGLLGAGGAAAESGPRSAALVHDGDTFGYDSHASNGPAHWGETFERCAGRNQSPVDLDTIAARSAHRPHLLWWNYFLKPRQLLMLNDGHTVKVYGKWAAPEEVPYHWAAPDGPHYVFDHIHFHWGLDDDHGSEHTLNRRQFPLELHAVHYRKDLGSLLRAMGQPGGLRVIGCFFRVSQSNNTGLQPVTAALGEVRAAHRAVQLPPVAFSDMLPPFHKHYITYNGSLTTPPCFETVSWVMRKDPLRISAAQLAEFRTLQGDSGRPIGHNYRPTQSLHERQLLQIR